MDEEDIVYEPCKWCDSYTEDCGHCKLNSIVETMLELNDMERSERAEEIGRQMAPLMD
jgi:hypothetical protein